MHEVRAANWADLAVAEQPGGWDFAEDVLDHTGIVIRYAEHAHAAAAAGEHQPAERFAFIQLELRAQAAEFFVCGIFVAHLELKRLPDAQSRVRGSYLTSLPLPGATDS